MAIIIGIDLRSSDAIGHCSICDYVMEVAYGLSIGTDIGDLEWSWRA